MSSFLRRGAVASVAALGVVQLVSFGQTIVLARLLTPAQVGVFAAGTVLALFLATLAEGALTQALVQRGDADLDDAADTVFRVTLVTGVLMAAATAAISPVIGIVFGDPVAGHIAAATAGTLVLHALTNVPDSLMQRRFDFRRRLVVDPAMAVVFAVVAVLCAVLGLGVWSLVVASYAQMATWAALSWSLGRWRPGHGRPSVAMWRELARFGYPLLLSSIADRVRDAGELLVVGRFLDTAALGFYRYGRRLASLPGVAVVQAGAFVLFPAFARIADDRDRLARAFLRSLTWIWVAALPLAAVLLAVGEPLAVVLLGEPWRGAGVALAAMAGVGPGQALAAVSTEVLKGSGRSGRLNPMTAVGLVAGIGLVLVGVPFGLRGVGAAMSVTALTVGVVGVAQARSTVGLPVSSLLSALGRPLLAVAPATVAAAGLDRLVLHAGERGTALGIGALVVEAAVVGIGYVLTLRVVAPDLGRQVLAATVRAARRSAGGD